VMPAASESTCGPESRVTLWLVLLCGVVIAVLLAAGLLYRANRQRGVKWVKAHVSVTPQSGPGATFQARADDGPGGDHAFAVIPLEVGRVTTTEENRS
jgi:hypothetical protein